MSRTRAGEVVEGLGANLRKLRTAQGLTQQALSERTGVKIETLSRVETGAVTPDLDTLVRVAGGLGVSLADALPTPERRTRGNRAEEKAAAALYRRVQALEDRDRELVFVLLERLEAVKGPG